MTQGDKINSAFFEYTISKTLGEGGNGYVYEAICEDKKTVAIKVLKEKNIKSEKFKRFKQELFFLLTHSHEGIVKVFDSGVTSQGNYFYVMPKAQNILNPFKISAILRETPKQQETFYVKQKAVDCKRKICHCNAGAEWQCQNQRAVQ